MTGMTGRNVMAAALRRIAEIVGEQGVLLCLPLQSFVAAGNVDGQLMLVAGIYLEGHQQRYSATMIIESSGKLSYTGLGIEKQQ